MPRVRYLLHLGVELDHSDDDGFTALHHAVLSGFEDVVDVLREAGADVNAQSLDCGTPLHLAAVKARRDVVRLLLRSRANVKALSRQMGSALHCAVYAGDLDVVSDLLAAGANAQELRFTRLSALYYMGAGPSVEGDTQIYQCAPLYLAARTGRSDVVDLLVSKGASPNAVTTSFPADALPETCEDEVAETDKYACTSLVAAACLGNSDMCREMLQHGAHIDAQDSVGCTALMVAAQEAKAQCLAVLLEHRASVELVSRRGWTALVYAVLSGKTDCIEILARKTGLQDGKAPAMASKALRFAAARGSLDAARIIIDAGADMNACDDINGAPLHIAASNGHPALVRLLFERGARPDVRYHENWSVLHCAAWYGHSEIVSTCLYGHQGLHPNVTTTSGMTPLHMACQEGYLSIVRILLEEGADVDALTKKRLSPLYFACTTGATAIVKTLIEQGADAVGLSTDGKTLLHAAAQKSHFAVLSLLVEHSKTLRQHDLIWAEDDQGKTALRYVECSEAYKAGDAESRAAANMLRSASPRGGTADPSASTKPSATPALVHKQQNSSDSGDETACVPALNPAEVRDYSDLFDNSPVQNGTLDGGIAKTLLEKAGLTNEVLAEIWALSDRKQRGALDRATFIVAMHLITSMKTRSMTALPNTLPPGIYEAAERPHSIQSTGQGRPAGEKKEANDITTEMSQLSTIDAKQRQTNRAQIPAAAQHRGRLRTIDMDAKAGLARADWQGRPEQQLRSKPLPERSSHSQSSQSRSESTKSTPTNLEDQAEGQTDATVVRVINIEFTHGTEPSTLASLMPSRDRILVLTQDTLWVFKSDPQVFARMNATPREWKRRSKWYTNLNKISELRTHAGRGKWAELSVCMMEAKDTNRVVTFSFQSEKQRDEWTEFILARIPRKNSEGNLMPDREYKMIAG